jgi:hypothetical protein
VGTRGNRKPDVHSIIFKAFAIAAAIGLLIGIVWTIAALWHVRVSRLFWPGVCDGSRRCRLESKVCWNATRQFVELYGAPLLLNRYLTIALALTILLAAGLLVLNFRTQSRYANLKPLVIRINEVGRAEAVDYDAATYRPQAPELRYFLTRFVVTHFSRLRAAVQRDYPDEERHAQWDRGAAISRRGGVPRENSIGVHASLLCIGTQLNPGMSMEPNAGGDSGCR